MWNDTKFIMKNLEVSFKTFRGTLLHQKKLFIKQLWLSQAKQLLKLFDVNMTAMVNGLIKINSELAIDFSFIDKILLNMVGIKKDKLIQALR